VCVLKEEEREREREREREIDAGVHTIDTALKFQFSGMLYSN
jgi:hypothetical protein